MTGAVAGVVAMVPEGLVLLTSIAFGLAAVTLARRRVLVQELPAVEGLARVDVVCLDKTGTLTEGIVEFDRIELLDPAVDEDVVTAALGAMSHDEGGNATQDAIAGAFPAPAGWARDRVVPFSSARKWSAASYGDRRGLGARRAGDGVARRARRRSGRQADELAAARKPRAAPRRAATRSRGTAPVGPRSRSRSCSSRRRSAPDAADTLGYFHRAGRRA